MPGAAARNAPRAQPWLGRWLPGVPPVLDPPTFARVRAALFLLALLPFLRLVTLTFTDGLGANPVEFMQRSLGTWTLALLLATLCITPLRWASGWAWLLRLRRMLGLFAFFYASLHVLAWIGLDLRFDLAAAWADVIKRPYVTAGAVAFLLMAPLAVTSSNAMVKRLGGRRWQQLHRLVYLVAVAAIVHYWWHKAGKNDFSTVSIYAAVVAALLGVRVLHWARHARQPR
jgi:sulfoxide reductase heme-binding subunit YedZ